MGCGANSKYKQSDGEKPEATESAPTDGKQPKAVSEYGAMIPPEQADGRVNSKRPEDVPTLHIEDPYVSDGTGSRPVVARGQPSPQNKIKRNVSMTSEAIEDLVTRVAGVKGSIDRSGFREMIQCIEPDFTEEEIMELFDEADLSETGVLDAQDLRAWYRDDLEGKDLIKRLREYYRDRRAEAQAKVKLPLVDLKASADGTQSMTVTPPHKREAGEQTSIPLDEAVKTPEKNATDAELEALYKEYTNAAEAGFTPESFLAIVRRLDPQAYSSDKEVRNLFDEIDLDSSGQVDLEEFIEWTRYELEGIDLLKKMRAHLAPQSASKTGENKPE